MAPERQTSSNRQKVTAGIVIVILIIVVWQIIGLLRGPTTTSSATPVLKSVTTTTSTTNTNNTMPNAMQQPMTASMQSPQGQAQQALQLQPKPTPVTKDMELLTLQQETQAKYISALNELQMLKVQREIGETNEAIIQAKLATVKAEKNINDLLTPQAPTQQVQVMPPPNYAAQLGGPSSQLPPGPPPSVVSAEPSYIVISVSYQLGRWTAVIGSQGKLYNVSMGDVLPGDGAIINRIDRQGIVVSKDGKRHRITITSAI